MARLPEYSRYRDCPISHEHDPLRFHYWPVLGRLYRRRIDGCVALLGSGRRVLDVGYGSGTSFLELGARFEEVHGLDTHDYGPSIASVFAREGLTVRLECGSIVDPPYADATFDAVLAMSLHRVLRPGGVLVVGVPGLNAMMTVGFWLMGCKIREHHFSSPEIVLAAAAERFTVERVVRQPPWAPATLETYVWFRARRA